MARSRRLLIGTTLPEQLTTSFFVHLAAFRDAGWDVSLACAPGEWPKGPPPIDVPVHRIAMVKPIAPGPDARALREWVRLLRRQPPDVLIGASPKAGLLTMIAGRFTGVPRRIFLHRGARWETLTGTSRRVTIAADRVTVAAATDVVAVSPSLAELLARERITRRGHPATVLAGGGSKGVDLMRFTPGQPTREPPFPTLLFLGRLAGDKGLPEVLSSFDATRAAHPHAQLVVVGDVDEADPPPAQVLARLRGDEGITWLGWVPDVVDIVRSADVLVFPSAREGLPNAVIEAAACGVPSVGWDVTGVRDAIADGATGRLVPRGGDFGAAVLDVLSRGRGAYREAARSWAARFDQQALSRAWVELLES